LQVLAFTERGDPKVGSLLFGLHRNTTRNEIEAMLAAQMAATHFATMTFARRLNHVETIPQQDSAERALNKLARTFAVQMETLKKFRAKADQTVRVERVLVNEGGQAIVGDVSYHREGSA
jgi:hypothetical protein